MSSRGGPASASVASVTPAARASVAVSAPPGPTIPTNLTSATSPNRASLARRKGPGRLWTLIPALLGLLAVAGILCLALGSVQVPPRTVAEILLGKLTGAAGAWTPGQETIVWELRLPRFLLAAMVGAGLAVAGAIFQGMFRNPMGDPYLLGVAPGAGLGATFVIVLGVDLGSGWLSTTPLAAFAGAVLATAIIYWLARVERATPVTTLLLAGVAVGSLLSAMTAFLMFARPDRLQQAMLWLFGSFSRTGWGSLSQALPYLVVGFVVALTQARPLNLLLLDEDQAQHLGVEVERTKLILVAAATLLSAASVAVSGLIGFVGLVAPHTARLLWGPDNRVLLPTSALTGALFLVLADLFARSVFAPIELPVGIVSALCGGPFFLYLLRHRKQISAL